MQFKQTHVTCYSITGIDAQIPRWLGIQEGVKKISNEIYEYQVRLVNSIEREYYHHYFERGVANGLLTGHFGKPPQDSSKTLKEFAKEKTKERLGQEKSVGLYLTVKIVRTVDLPINSAKYVADKGDFYIGIQAFPNERESFRKNIDGLNSYFICRLFSTLTSSFEGVIFAKCLDFSYYHGTPKKLYDYFPQFGGHAIVIKKVATNELKKVVRSLRKGTVSYDEKAVKLYRKMLDETDGLKKFLFGYFSLEVATSRAFKANKSRFDLTQKIRDNRDIKESYADMQNEYCQNATNSRDKFLFNSFFYWEDIGKADYERFKKAKKTRDELSHGEIPDESNIPLRELNHILAKVMQNELN